MRLVEEAEKDDGRADPGDVEVHVVSGAVPVGEVVVDRGVETGLYRQTYERESFRKRQPQISPHLAGILTDDTTNLQYGLQQSTSDT